MLFMSTRNVQATHLNYHFWEIGTKKYVHTKILLSVFCVSSNKTLYSNSRDKILEIKTLMGIKM